MFDREAELTCLWDVSMVKGLDDLDIRNIRQHLLSFDDEEIASKVVEAEDPVYILLTLLTHDQAMRVLDKMPGNWRERIEETAHVSDEQLVAGYVNYSRILQCVVHFNIKVSHAVFTCLMAECVGYSIPGLNRYLAVRNCEPDVDWSTDTFSIDGNRIVIDVDDCIRGELLAKPRDWSVVDCRPARQQQAVWTTYASAHAFSVNGYKTFQ